MPGPKLDVLHGALPADGWATARLALRVEPERGARTIRIAVRNPTAGAQHLRNKVRIDLDGQTVFDEVLFPGGGVTLDQDLGDCDELLVEVHSQAVMAPDRFDPRERGVFVKITETARGKAKA
ncbi:MAG: hypothetical protein ACXW3D_06275 [Caulobacteraceae bacterium]